MVANGEGWSEWQGESHTETVFRRTIGAAPPELQVMTAAYANELEDKIRTSIEVLRDTRKFVTLYASGADGYAKVQAQNLIANIDALLGGQDAQGSA